MQPSLSDNNLGWVVDWLVDHSIFFSALILESLHLYGGGKVILGECLVRGRAEWVQSRCCDSIWCSSCDIAWCISQTLVTLIGREALVCQETGELLTLS